MKMIPTKTAKFLFFAASLFACNLIGESLNPPYAAT